MHAQIDDLGRTPLHFAVLELAHEALLSIAPDPKLWVADKIGRTPLHLAAACGDDSILRLLLEVRPKEIVLEELCIQDKYGRNPLHWACRAGAATATTLLLQLGLEARYSDINGQTLSILATRAASLACLKLLEPTDLTLQDYLGRTALHWAANSDCLECFEWILDRVEAAELLRKDKKSEETALDLCNPTLLTWVAQQSEVPAYIIALARHRLLLETGDLNALHAFWLEQLPTLSLIHLLEDPKVQGYLTLAFPERVQACVREEWKSLSRHLHIDLLHFALASQIQESVNSWDASTLDDLLSLQLSLGQGKMVSGLALLRHLEKMHISGDSPTERAAFTQVVRVFTPAILAAGMRHPQLRKTVLHLFDYTSLEQAQVIKALL